MIRNSRYFRITWSILCGSAAVLLAVLWVRSYGGPGTGYLPVPGVCCRSAEGILLIARFGTTPKPPDKDKERISIMSFTDPRMGKPIDVAPNHKWGGFYFMFTDTSFYWMQAPYWFLIAVSGTFSAAPWIRQRVHFSLRTLLIVTTLIAVLLGLVVWSIR